MSTGLIIGEDVNLIMQLSRDLRQGARGLGMRDARYLVDLYYSVQGYRIRTGHIIRASGDVGEPVNLLEYIYQQFRRLEGYLTKALEEFAAAHPLGERWLSRVIGIGPILAAGFISQTWEYDFRTVSALWRFAGLDPTLIWARGQKRPFNARLKLLCFKAGESFVKTQHHEDAFYGRYFVKVKVEEWQRNLAGRYADIARAKAPSVGASTTARKWYSGAVRPEWAAGVLRSGTTWPELLPHEALGDGLPMLPPAHIHARARRRTVKLFLSHLWEVSHYLRHGRRPAEQPWVFTYGGHTHKVEVPHAPWNRV